MKHLERWYCTPRRIRNQFQKWHTITYNFCHNANKLTGKLYHLVCILRSHTLSMLFACTVLHTRTHTQLQDGRVYNKQNEAHPVQWMCLSTRISCISTEDLLWHQHAFVVRDTDKIMLGPTLQKTCLRINYSQENTNIKTLRKHSEQTFLRKQSKNVFKFPKFTLPGWRRIILRFY